MKLELTFIMINICHSVLTANNPNNIWSCLTPYNEPGQCIPIQQCTKVWEIVTLAPRPLTIRIINFLKEIVCGNPLDRTVCCRNQDVSMAYSGQTVQKDFSKHQNIHLLNQGTCGISNAKEPSTGLLTNLYEFPWMALLGYEDKTTNGPEWRGSGTIITKRLFFDY